jgi:peptidyl-dipeptidase Dcp
LATGDSRDPMDSFRAFLGRAPDPAALMRARHLADA